MRRLLVFVLPLGLLLTGCRMQVANRLLNGNGSPTVLAVPTETLAISASDVPTQTPLPTATITPVPTPDLSLIGLPSESAGTNAFDFVETMCQAQWFTELGDLPCPGNDSQADTGYVMQLNADVQGLPSNFNILLTFPPQQNVETIFSKYPAFTVKKGDRFQAVLACRAHTFCDVVFELDFFDQYSSNGLAHWHYLFADAPLVIDYPLDGLAGKTVQFGLAVRAGGDRSNASAVWIVPHIYRPTP